MSKLGHNEAQIFPTFVQLDTRIKCGQLLLDKSGVQIAEVFMPRFMLDPMQETLSFPGRETDKAYVEQEKAWYLSMDRKITGYVDNVKIWRDVADKDGVVNSNYGWLVFSKDNGHQFDHAALTLKAHKESRQAVIIYQRPTMHDEWCENGRFDFICTNYQHFFIRDNALYCITSMRSQDAWFGLFNDIPWFHYVINKMHEKLQKTYTGLQLGSHIFVPNSFHIYERHFSKLSQLVDEVVEGVEYETKH